MCRCRPCSVFSPVVRSLALSTPTIKFFRIDTDECDTLSQRFGIRSLPSFRFVRGGHTAQDVVATVDANEDFLYSFYTSLATVSTHEEQLRLQQSRNPEAHLKPSTEVSFLAIVALYSSVFAMDSILNRFISVGGQQSFCVGGRSFDSGLTASGVAFIVC